MYTLKSATRLAVALGVMLSLAAGAVQDLKKPIEFFPGTIMFFTLAEPDKVQLNWNDPDDGPLPVLGEDETWVIISVQLKEGRSIGRFDYVLNNQECLGLRIDEEGPFDCNLMEVDAKKSKSVQLLYKTEKNDKFSFDITYVMNSLPPNYRAVSIDISDPLPAPVEGADEAAGGDAGDEAAAADVAMPEGFAFAWLGDLAEGDVVLNEKIGEGVEVHSQGDYVTLVSGSDAIAGTTGFGLEVKREGETMTWAPAKVALYRDQALVGVYDPATKAVSMDANAPKSLKLPEAPAEAAPAAAAPAAAAVAPAEDPKPAAAAAKPKDPVKPKETSKPKPAADAGGGWGF